MTENATPRPERSGRVLRFELSQPTPSLNATKGHHWGRLRKYKRLTSQEILVQLRGRAPAQPFARAKVEITRYGIGKQLDEDNLKGGCKELIDCLKPTAVKTCVSRTTKARTVRITNSYGRGIIEDDDPDHMVLIATSVHVKARSLCRTIVVITELMP